MADSLLLIRSGATDYELQGRIRGTLDVPLAPAGVADAQRAAARVAALQAAGDPVVALYTATGMGAEATARIVGAEIGLRPRSAPGLGNLDQGLWQGMLVDDIRRKQPRLYRQWKENPWSVSAPEGELLEEACDRVERVIERLVKRHGEGRMALVVPGPLDRIIRWLAAGEPLSDLWAYPTDGPSVIEIPLAAQWNQGAAIGNARA